MSVGSTAQVLISWLPLKPLPLSQPADAALVDTVVNQQAVMLATNETFWLSGIFFGALMVLVWLAQPPRREAGVETSGAREARGMVLGWLQKWASLPGISWRPHR